MNQEFDIVAPTGGAVCYDARYSVLVVVLVVVCIGLALSFCLRLGMDGLVLVMVRPRYDDALLFGVIGLVTAANRGAAMWCLVLGAIRVTARASGPL